MFHQKTKPTSLLKKMSDESMYRESPARARLPCIVQVNDPQDMYAYIKTTSLTDKEARLFEKLQEYPAVDRFYVNYADYLYSYFADANNKETTTESIMRGVEMQHEHLAKLHPGKQAGMESFFPLQDYKDCVLDLVKNFHDMKWSICTDSRAIVKFSWKGNHHVIVLPFPYSILN